LKSRLGAFRHEVHLRGLEDAMLTEMRIEDADEIERLRDAYVRTVSAPMDGMWEGTAIAGAAFWAIREDEQPIGHFCLDTTNRLVRFAVAANDQVWAGEKLRWVITMHGVRQAVVGENEPLYYAACMMLPHFSTVHAYLFQDFHVQETAPDAAKGMFNVADVGEADTFLRFYRDNLDGVSASFDAFVRERLAHAELCALWDGAAVLAIGECIPSQRQAPYADLGMIVSRTRRSQGLGSTMLLHLKQHCYRLGWRPICSCDADNIASMRAIEKAGFICEHHMLALTFA
jgi:RimJ/RimL family protein N-acetyltransferase